MSHIVADRVVDNTSTTGTSAFVLGSPSLNGYRNIRDVCANNDTIWYTAAHRTLSQWEVGKGTYGAGTGTLTRTTVLASSNAGSAVNFSAGIKDIVAGVPASMISGLSVASSTDNAIVRFNGTSGALQNSSVTIDDSGNISGLANIPTRLATGEVNFYVNHSTGSDVTGAGTIGNPWQTANFALFYILTYYTWSSTPQSQVVINLADNVTDTTGIHYAGHGMTGAQGGAALYLRGATRAISAAADNGSGKVRLTVASTTGMTTGDLKAVTTNVSAYNGMQSITVINGTTIDLTEVNYTSTATGTITGCSYLAKTGSESLSLYWSGFFQTQHVRIREVLLRNQSRIMLSTGTVIGDSAGTPGNHMRLIGLSHCELTADIGFTGSAAAAIDILNSYFTSEGLYKVHFEKDAAFSTGYISMSGGHCDVSGGHNLHSHTITGRRASYSGMGGRIMPGSASLTALPGDTAIAFLGACGYHNNTYFGPDATDVAWGAGTLATNAVAGFLYVPTCAGTPTGTPTGVSGYAPIVVNTTNNKLYFYSGGAWRDAGP